MASSVDMELGDMMYELCLMALFFVEGANLLVPFRENFNFKRIVARFSSFFKGFIGAGGWGLKAQKLLGTVKIHTRAVVLNDRRIWLFTGTYLQSVCVKSFHCGNILIIAGSVLTCLLFKSRKVG